jgi:hypothetical protein
MLHSHMATLSQKQRDGAVVVGEAGDADCAAYAPRVERVLGSVVRVRDVCRHMSKAGLIRGVGGNVEGGGRGEEECGRREGRDEGIEERGDGEEGEEEGGEEEEEEEEEEGEGGEVEGGGEAVARGGEVGQAEETSKASFAQLGFGEAAGILLSVRLGVPESSNYVRVDNGTNVEAEVTSWEVSMGLIRIAERLGQGREGLEAFMERALGGTRA